VLESEPEPKRLRPIGNVLHKMSALVLIEMPWRPLILA
jgi:hypothetical protein